MTLVTALNDATGDYESIKTIEFADETLVKIKYTAQKMDYGGMFDAHAPKLRQYVSRRVVRREDMRTSRAYLKEFAPEIPEAVPGMTAVGTSSVVLEELKTRGEAEFGISHWTFPRPPTLDPNDTHNIYRKQMSIRSKVLETRFGIEAARLTTEGFGETRPRGPNDTLAGRSRNRRVELARMP